MAKKRKTPRDPFQISIGRDEELLFEFVIHGRITSKKNSRPMQKRGNKLVPGGKSPTLRHTESELKRVLEAAYTGPVLTCPVLVEVDFYYQGPEPDTLGPLETLWDGLQGVVVEDDRQCRVGRCKKIRIKGAVYQAAHVTLRWRADGGDPDDL